MPGNQLEDGKTGQSGKRAILKNMLEIIWRGLAMNSNNFVI
jgi:hypothetical protein